MKGRQNWPTTGDPQFGKLLTFLFQNVPLRINISEENIFGFTWHVAVRKETSRFRTPLGEALREALGEALGERRPVLQGRTNRNFNGPF